jgi:signal transduction histidine kinase
MLTKAIAALRSILRRLSDWALAVPVRIKIVGIMTIPVVVLGLVLSYWIRTGLSDWLSYLLSDVRVQAAMEAGTRSVVFVTVLAAAFSIALTYLLMYILTHPLLELRSTALQVAKGDLESRSRVFAKDEIGEVAQSMNTMIDHLLATQEDLKRSNRRLEAMNQVAMAASQELEIHDILYRILAGILDTLDLQSGWIYLYDPERDAFHLASWHDIPTEMEQQLLLSKSGSRCACMHALIQDELGVLPCVQECNRIKGLVSGTTPLQHLTLPIEAQDLSLGVLNLLCKPDQIPSEHDLALLHDLGSQISEIVANAWLQLKLGEKESSRQALLAALVKAQEDERTRLAHELHDGAGQTLTSLLLQMKSLEKRANAPEQVKTIQHLCDLVSQTIEDIRALSYQLRPIVLEEFGLATAMTMLVEDTVQDAGLQVSYQYNLGEAQLPFEIETILYRVSQESLTNVIRHAQAEHVSVIVSLQDGKLLLQVEDDGIGFDPQDPTLQDGRQRLGLLGMQERVDGLGGTLALYTSPGEGTSLRITLPLPMELGK